MESRASLSNPRTSASKYSSRGESWESLADEVIVIPVEKTFKLVQGQTKQFHTKFTSLSTVRRSPKFSMASRSSPGAMAIRCGTPGPGMYSVVSCFSSRSNETSRQYFGTRTRSEVGFFVHLSAPVGHTGGKNRYVSKSDDLFA